VGCFPRLDGRDYGLMHIARTAIVAVGAVVGAVVVVGAVAAAAAGGPCSSAAGYSKNPVVKTASCSAEWGRSADMSNNPVGG